MNVYYRAINIILVSFTLFLLAGVAKYSEQLARHGTVSMFLVLAVSAVLVHGIKGLRLYFEMYEKQMAPGLFIRQYCKVTPAVMVLPFKIGDLFRVYCFGYHLKDYMTGIAVILFDRFVDTLALVTVMLVVSLYLSSAFGTIFFMMVFALCFMIGIYYICPGMCSYWNRYFLVQKATKERLRTLQLISKVQREYRELRAVVNGKFLIAYVLSLLAWIVEIGGLYILNSFILKENGTVAIKEYLSSALTGTGSEYLGSFICLSVLLLLLVYFVVSVTYWLRKADRHE